MTIGIDSKKRTAVQNVLESRGIIRRNGHFEYISGEHGTDAVDTNTLYQDPKLLSFIARQLAKRFKGMGIDVVVGLTGSEARSIHLALLAALELPGARIVELHKNGPHDPCSLRANDMKFVKKKRVLLIDDVVRRGETITSAVNALRRHQAQVVGISVICRHVHEAFECDLTSCVYRSLVSLNYDRWTALRCKKHGPCKHGTPLVSVKNLPTAFPMTGK